ncbi:HAD family phosphatase [Nocardioides sp. 503]|uniref:HAD family hydrolase n=1 Tax=Nocardioides sp. 503 TaxID=2508326 RepID=UPI001430BE72|nr:HAD family phosphatase [Nocardioides sp. 503]
MRRPDHRPGDARPALLLDADGTLFPSEEPAFEASTRVTNAFLRELGSTEQWTPDELRQRAVGRNFRSLATDLARDAGRTPRDVGLEAWVAREQEVVTTHLAATLRPDPEVTAAVRRLARHWRLAVVSSSALARLDACFRVTGLADLLPPESRYSAQDSLPVPTSKPDPAVYTAAVAALGVPPAAALAVEDAASGVTSAAAAGIPVVGILAFVPPAERSRRAADLVAAGARTVGKDWELVEAAAAVAHLAALHALTEDVGGIADRAPALARWSPVSTGGVPR